MATSKRTNAVGARNPREDERLHHDPATAARGSRAQEDAARVSDDGTALTMEQRVAMIRNEFQQEALPKTPLIPGYHLCWLSTTNSYDPIHKRMRLGYTPVKVEELNGFDSMRMTTGEFAGTVACNEMLLFKIPSELYQAIMREFHHNMPLEEEETLRRQLDQLEASEDSTGRKLGQVAEDSDGFKDLVKKREGVFAD